MSEFIFHFGMPKTGTTSLQAMFSGKHPCGTVFVEPTSPIFPTTKYLAPLMAGKRSAHEISEAGHLHHAYIISRYETSFAEARERLDDLFAIGSKRLVISDENVLSFAGLDDLMSEVRARYEAVEFLAYLRPLVDTIPSAIQQEIINNPEICWVHLNNKKITDFVYLFISNFQRDSQSILKLRNFGGLHLRAYTDGSQNHTSLMEDFSSFTGLHPLHRPQRLNVSATADTLAIAYALLVHLGNTCRDGRVYRQYLSLLGGFGTGRIGLAKNVQQRIIREVSKEFAWVSDLVGFDIVGERPDPDLDVVAPDNLLRHASSLHERVCQHLQDRWNVTINRSDTLPEIFANLLKELVTKSGALSRLPADFDPERYLSRHRDVTRAGIDADIHYRTCGFNEGRH